VTSAEQDVSQNRRSWDEYSDEYQAMHAAQLNRKELAWGTFAVPEDDLHVLGDVAGKDILEFGCGAAQWSIFLSKRGARPVGFDLSGRQLRHAVRLMGELGASVPIVQASAIAVPFRDESFDIVFCDHGAMSFADPYRTVPEAARVLRLGGLFAFNMITPLFHICIDPVTDELDDRLHAAYFGMHRFEWPDDHSVEFHLSYGDWISVLAANGFTVERLVELQAPAGAVPPLEHIPPGWAERWPSEEIWVARRMAT